MPTPITDSHVHLWTDDPARYPEPEPRPEYMYRRCYETADFFTEAGPSGVTRAVLVQSSCYGDNHRYLADLIATSPSRFSGVAVLSPTAPEPDRRMHELAANGFRGFRIQALGEGANDRWLDGPGYEAMFRCAAASAHAGPRLAICPLIDPAALPALGRMCGRFPEARVVIDHLARIGLQGDFPTADVDRLLAMARCPNVYVKVSAFYALGTRRPPHAELAPLIQRVVEVFGARRLMWGSDCPYQTHHEPYDEAVALLRDGLEFIGPEERSRLLHTTAGEVFF